MADNGDVRREITVLERDGRMYAEVMSLEVFIRDFAEALRERGMEQSAKAVEMVADAVANSAYPPREVK